MPRRPDDSENWGGTREGAGRPPDGKFKRVALYVSVDPRTKDAIDQMRGKLSRGKYLDKVVWTMYRFRR